MRRQVYVEPGQRVPVIGCYSEMMCHFRLAGRPVEIAIVPDRNLRGEAVADSWMAQVYRDGTPFSGPILPGEAGFFYDRERSSFYTYAAEPGEAGDADPAAVLAGCRKLLHDAIAASGVEVVTITDLGLNF
jgi:hypothetical protein